MTITKQGTKMAGKSKRANAVTSLYGGSVAREALAGNVGGQVREQTVLTPRWLLDELCTSAGTPLMLDPCTEPDNPTGAEFFLTVEDDGLTSDWSWYPDGWVYVNPPYADLETWLAKCAQEASHGARIYALVPFRPHRAWFCGHAAGRTVVSLRPFAFAGHVQAFPAALCIVSWGLPVPEILDTKGRNLVTGVWSLAE